MQCLFPTVTSERRRQSLVNNMGAIQVWLDNSSVLAFWICSEYDNEHSDVWRVTCDVLHWSRKYISIYLYSSASTSTFLCPHHNYGNISTRTNWIINSALKLTKVGSDCTIIVNINKPQVQQLWPEHWTLNNLPLIICISISFSFVHQ